MKTIKDIQNLKGVKVLMRVDFNVPVVNGVVADDFRIRKIMPTLTYLREKGAKTILISHIENNADAVPKGDPTTSSSKQSTSQSMGQPSLEPVANHLKKLGIECVFVKKYRDAAAEIEKIAGGGASDGNSGNSGGDGKGDFILLENLRVNEGEKKNDKKFAAELASLADLYINEAFSVSHRAHASIVAITEFLPSYAGFLFEAEVGHLGAAFHPKRPFLFILGGAKFETKLPLIEKFMNVADAVFVGGALANNFFKEKGLNLGTSLVSPQDFNLKRFLDNPKLLLPIDVVVTDTGGQGNVNGGSVSGDVNGQGNAKKIIKKPDALLAGDSIMDAGPATLEMLQKIISSGTIGGEQKLTGKPAQVLWNGPLGAYEKGFKESTLSIAKAVAESGADTIVGGGDTLAAIAELNVENKFSFVSTGGGAMLDFLADGTLPGIEALEKSTM